MEKKKLEQVIPTEVVPVVEVSDTKIQRTLKEITTDILFHKKQIQLK